MQKGNAPVERKLQRLFRRGDACRLIKRCNDFGAGGVSVAVGELADGLYVDPNKVSKKYEGLDGTELAISGIPGAHGRGRGRRGCGRVPGYAKEENLEAEVIATVTEEPRMTMVWNGDTIVGSVPRVLSPPTAPEASGSACRGAARLRHPVEDRHTRRTHAHHAHRSERGFQ